MNLLEVSHLKKYYETHKAVDDVSFSIQEGSIFGMLGPNGAGKTTLLRMLTGIFFPDEGQILFNNKPFDPENDIQHIGYMPEERGLYKKMKVGEQTLYLAQLKGLSKKAATERVKYWFDKFDINSWYNKKVDELSKGMQQKVQFISTILHQPKLLILDEPFTGLDPINSELIKQEIFNLSKQGTTIIFSTHRMEQVEEICDHIMLVNKGRKILDGSVANIKQDFKQGLYKVGLGSMPNAAQMATWRFDIIKTHDKAFTVKLNEDSTTNDILRHFINQDIPVVYFEEILPTINEVFIKQVKQTEEANSVQTSPALS